jgi:16S rRNA (cytosine1402-N4)-methyltransferase
LENFVHQTVLREETVSLLLPEGSGPGRVIVDGTLGGGGHTELLLERGAAVIGVDQDPRALEAAQTRLARFPKFRAVKGNFRDISTLLAAEAPFDGVLVDLGVSSPQLDTAERGFSFQTDGPLDMRMSDEGPTVAERIADADERELLTVLREFGEEPFARPIARELKALSPQTTFEAVEAVKRAVPRKAWPDRIHVATKTFQALRIWVNDELGALDDFLAAIPNVIKLHGRVAVIAFHSLEDRRVKEAFRALKGQCVCPPGLPICACGVQSSFNLLTTRAVTASDEEQAQNPRARSARLRAMEKIR